jgi:flagellar biosynthetic protein FliO
MNSLGGVLQYLASFALVVALLLGLLWSLTRLQGTRAFQRREQRLQVVESLALGARLKVALVRCDGRELLVGVTPTQISPLGSWRAAGADAPAASFSSHMAAHTPSQVHSPVPSQFPQEPRS